MIRWRSERLRWSVPSGAPAADSSEAGRDSVDAVISSSVVNGGARHAAPCRPTPACRARFPCARRGAPASAAAGGCRFDVLLPRLATTMVG